MTTLFRGFFAALGTSALVLVLANATGSAQPATPSPAPAASAAPLYKFVYLPTPSPGTTPFPGPRAPQILEIDMSEQTILTPGQLRVRVLTNPEVVTVIGRTMGYEIAIPRQSPGVFSGSQDIGPLPAFLLRRTYDVDFVASVQDGRNSVVTLQLGLK